MAKTSKKHTSSGFGMPSAYGSEWKGQDAGESKKKFDENYDHIDWSDNGRVRDVKK